MLTCINDYDQPCNEDCEGCVRAKFNVKCAGCGEDIRAEDKYGEFVGDIYCQSCSRENALQIILNLNDDALLELVGVRLKTLEEYDYE